MLPTEKVEVEVRSFPVRYCLKCGNNVPFYVSEDPERSIHHHSIPHSHINGIETAVNSRNLCKGTGRATVLEHELLDDLPVLVS